MIQRRVRDFRLDTRLKTSCKEDISTMCFYGVREGGGAVPTCAVWACAHSHVLASRFPAGRHERHAVAWVGGEHQRHVFASNFEGALTQSLRQSSLQDAMRLGGLKDAMSAMRLRGLEGCRGAVPSGARGRQCHTCGGTPHTGAAALVPAHASHPLVLDARPGRLGPWQGNARARSSFRNSYTA